MHEKDLMSIYRPHAKQWLKKNYDSEYTEHHVESLAYLLTTCYADGDNVKAEKSLLKKTQKHHEHGTVAPSCVGCPTAEAMIKKDMVFVRREMITGTIKVLEYIMESDKSEKYEYGESRANGDKPKADQRFLTPSEIALGELAHLHGLGFTAEKEQ